MSSHNGSGSASDAATIYLGHVISPTDWTDLTEFRDGALVVSKAGKILDIGEARDLVAKYKESPVVNLGKWLILPGMIDLHVHLAQTAEAGRWGRTLLGWLNNYIYPAEARFAERVHAQKIAGWFFRQLAANGTTLAAVYTTVHAEATEIAFQTAANMGSRVIMGKVMMDANAPDSLLEDTQTSLEESRTLCERWHGYDNGRLMYAFTPRFAPTSTKELLAGTGRLWREFPGSYMQTHLSENTDEIAWVKELFPESADYLDVYDSHGIVGEKSIFAHAIHLTEHEFARLKESKASVAHCASSNFFLKSGVFPMERVRKDGIRFGLGSDVAAGPEMSMFGVMRDTAFIQPELWISPRELLFMSTLAGARAAGLDHMLGNLEIGKEADFIVVDPSIKDSVPNDIFTHSTDDILSSLVYQGDDRMVKATFVRGRQVHGNALAAFPNPGAVRSF